VDWNKFAELSMKYLRVVCPICNSESEPLKTEGKKLIYYCKNCEKKIILDFSGISEDFWREEDE